MVLAHVWQVRITSTGQSAQLLCPHADINVKSAINLIQVRHPCVVTQRQSELCRKQPPNTSQVALGRSQEGGRVLLMVLTLRNKGNGPGAEAGAEPQAPSPRHPRAPTHHSRAGHSTHLTPAHYLQMHPWLTVSPAAYCLLCAVRPPLHELPQLNHHQRLRHRIQVG
jgi:hypothetical protein